MLMHKKGLLRFAIIMIGISFVILLNGGMWTSMDSSLPVSIIRYLQIGIFCLNTYCIYSLACGRSSIIVIVMMVVDFYNVIFMLVIKNFNPKIALYISVLSIIMLVLIIKMTWNLCKSD